MATQQVSDEELTLAFQAGDSLSFDTLFQRYQRPIFNYVFRMSGNLAVSEDLTQDVFLRVFSALGRAGKLDNFRAWLYRVATNVTISHLRKRPERFSSLEDSLERQVLREPRNDARDDPEARQVRREEIDEVALALQRMPDAHRQVIVLRQLHGLSYQDMAAVMSLSVEAVTSLLHRARRDFREQMIVMTALDRGEAVRKQKREERS